MHFINAEQPKGQWADNEAICDERAKVVMKQRAVEKPE
jgi:hypothetical protein